MQRRGQRLAEPNDPGCGRARQHRAAVPGHRGAEVPGGELGLDREPVARERCRESVGAGREQLLTQQINPSLAAHGGFAQLAGVEGTVVYVTMGGGCQGCAVSAMTLRDGIARSIREAIPEVTDVVDTTDHESGENPYYT